MVTGLGPAKVMGGRFSAPLVLKEQLRKEHEMGLDRSNKYYFVLLVEVSTFELV